MNKRTQTEIRYEENVVNNYGKAPLTLVKGAGTRVWDERGNEYLDFVSGIAVNTLGHSHPVWVRRIQEQASTLGHCSNLYRNEPQSLLAEKINALAGGGKKVFFCNSGAEANEALIKLARLYGKSKAGEEGKCFKILTAEKAFHGRTFGSMAATPQDKIQGGFRPMLGGFAHGIYNDVESFRKLVDENTCAILLETIQGESGILPATMEFLQGIRALCDEHEILLMLDEVQCGAGRTGKYFNYQHYGIEPDAVSMAKGIAGGFPMGGIWALAELGDLFTPGSHGTTFGGTPMACVAALATIEILEEEHLLDNVTRLSNLLTEELGRLGRKYPHLISGVRGMGFMIALSMKGDPGRFVTKLMEHGLLTVRAGTDAIRFLPPLNLTEEELQKAISIVDRCFSELSE
jgi:acetylornithine aminotransferase/acetylornithine/N-succinyldiaminopimelate aminotransferase